MEEKEDESFVSRKTLLTYYFLKNQPYSILIIIQSGTFNISFDVTLFQQIHLIVRALQFLRLYV